MSRKVFDMRCVICNIVIQQPQWNDARDEFDPCTKCLEEIREAVKSDEDSPEEPDDFEYYGIL